MIEKRRAAYRVSTTVALILAVLTIIEYFVALYINTASVMMGIGLMKAYCVVHYFMHISRLWSEEDH